MSSVNKDNYMAVCLDEYVRDFFQIYNPYLVQEGKKARAVLDIWLHVVAHASLVGEAIRKLRYDEALNELAEVAVWVMNFVGKCGNLDSSKIDGVFFLDADLSDIIWNKYPGICQYCLEPMCRQCWVGKELEQQQSGNQAQNGNTKPLTKQEKKDIRKKKAEGTRSSKPKSILAWEDAFRAVYQLNIFGSSIDGIAFHLLEEVGEVARALTDMYTWQEESESKETNAASARMEELKEELADVMSWTFTLTLKLQDEFEKVKEEAKKFRRIKGNPSFRISLADAIWRNYGGDKNSLHCKKCGNSPCTCQTYFSARDGFQSGEASV